MELNAKDHEMLRKQLWAAVYVAYVRADNSTSDKGAPVWADRCLENFDARFPKSACVQLQERQ